MMMTGDVESNHKPQQQQQHHLGHHVGFVGVHIGAGQHSESRTPLYLSICSAACAAAIKVLRSGGSALEAAAQATMVLEDAGETNAGFGSNLTESGTVEMDAGIMDGSNLLFGAVGAIPGIKNPIRVAKLLVDEQNKGLLPLGRVPPIFMVGEGARDWAVRHGIPSVPQSTLMSEKASRLFRHYKKKLDSLRGTPVPGSGLTVSSANSDVTSSSTGAKRTSADELTEEIMASKKIGLEMDGGEQSVPVDRGQSSNPDGKHPKEDDILTIDDQVTDTVGVVVMDCLGNISSTVSSGGIALKQPGRVGQASCFGCGCWAQNSVTPLGFGVGVSTTGCGEHLVRTFLAKECATVLGNSKMPLTALKDVMKERFAESEFLSSVSEKLGGAICLHLDRPASRGEFLWTHTTSSMGLAFQTTNCQKATAKMSRLPHQPPRHGSSSSEDVDGATSTTTILVESVMFDTSVQASSFDEKDLEETAEDLKLDSGDRRSVVSSTEVQMSVEGLRA